MFPSSPIPMEANISVPQTPSFTGWNDYPHDESSSSPSLCTFADREEEQILDITSSESWTEQNSFVLPEIEYGGVLAGRWNPCTGGLSIGKYLESLDTPLSYRSLAFRWEQLGRPHLENLRIPLDLLSRSGEVPSAVNFRRDLSEIADLQEATLIQKLGSGKDEYNSFSDPVQLFVGFASYLDIYCAVNAELTALEQDLSIDEQSSTYQETFHRFLGQIEQDRVICAQSCPHHCLGYLLWGEVYTWSLEEKHLRFEAYRQRSRDRQQSGSTFDICLNTSPSPSSFSPTSDSTRDWVSPGNSTPASLLRRLSDSVDSGERHGLDCSSLQEAHSHERSPISSCWMSRQHSDRSHTLSSQLNSPRACIGRKEFASSDNGSDAIRSAFAGKRIFSSKVRHNNSPSIGSADSFKEKSSGYFDRIEAARAGRRPRSYPTRPFLTKSYTTDMIREEALASKASPSLKRRRVEHCRLHSACERTANHPWSNSDDSCESESGHFRSRTRTESGVDHQFTVAQRYEAMLENAFQKLDAAVRLLHMEAKKGNRLSRSCSSTSLRRDEW